MLTPAEEAEFEKLDKKFGSEAEKGSVAAQEAGRHAGSEGGAGKYAAMVPRALASIPGYTADLLKLGPELVAKGIGAIAGKPYEINNSYGERSKAAIDKATKNYAKPNTKGEKIYEAILDVVGPGKAKAANSLLGKIGKTAASRIPVGALAGIGEATDSPILAGLVAPLAWGSGKGTVNYLRNQRNLSNVKKHQEKFIQGISKKSEHHFDPFTHEVAGQSLHQQALKNAYKDAAIESGAAKDVLEKIRKNQALHIASEKGKRANLRSEKKAYSQAYFNPEDISYLSSHQPEAIGAALQSGAKKSKQMWGDYIGKRYNTPEMLKFQETARIHGDPAIEWFSHSYHNLESPALKKQLVNTPVGKTVKTILGLSEDATPQAFEEALRKVGPTTLNYHETKQLLGALSDAAGDQSGIYGKNAKKQLNHLAGNLSKQVEEAAEHAGVGPHYQRNKAIVKLQKENIVEPVNTILKPGTDTAISYHDITSDKNKSSKVLEQARKFLPLEEQRVLGNTIVKDLGFKGGDFSSDILRQKFLSMPHSSQRSVLSMMHPDLRGKLKAHVNHPDTYEAINKKIPEYVPIHKDAKQKARQAIENAKPKEVLETPAQLFQTHSRNVLAGKERPRFASTSSGMAREMGQDAAGNYNIAELRLALNKAQPEVRKSILARLPPSVKQKLEEGFEELDFLNKIAGSRHGLEGAGDLVSKVSPKAGLIKSAAKKVFYANPEKQFQKAKKAYEMKRTGTTPGFFKPQISAASIGRAARPISRLTPEENAEFEALDRKFGGKQHHAHGDIVRSRYMDGGKTHFTQERPKSCSVAVARTIAKNLGAKPYETEEKALEKINKDTAYKHQGRQFSVEASGRGMSPVNALHSFGTGIGSYHHPDRIQHSSLVRMAQKGHHPYIIAEQRLNGAPTGNQHVMAARARSPMSDTGEDAIEIMDPMHPNSKKMAVRKIKDRPFQIGYNMYEKEPELYGARYPRKGNRQREGSFESLDSNEAGLN